MRRLLLVTLATLGVTPAAAGAAAPRVIVWSGGLAPGSTAQGVDLRAGGGATRLSSDAHGTIRAVGRFRLRAGALRAIRASAVRVLVHGPTVTHAAVADGGYVTVLVQRGARRRLVTDTGVVSPAVATLLERLDAALPRRARLAGAGLPESVASKGPVARAAARSPFPDTAACPAGHAGPVEIVKRVPLQQAASEGIATNLTPKGTIGGDAVGFDGAWDRTSGSATITIHAEVSGPGATDWAEQVSNALGAATTNANGAPRYSVDGEPVSFQFDFRNRTPGDSPLPCYDQIRMTRDTNAAGDPERSAQEIGPETAAGVWVIDDPDAWPHEMGHMLGLDDAYHDYFVFNDDARPSIPLPERGLEGEDLQRALPPDVLPSDGNVVSIHDTPDAIGDHGDDLMADTGPNFREGDLAAVIANADLEIHADVGTILVNKDGADQNLAVGAPFDVRIPFGHNVHQDGIVAYCIDLLDHHSPGESGSAGFDVLPTAGELGGAAMSALQRVLEVVAAREPGPLEETPGANAAIWHVTDDVSVTEDSDPAAASILEAAGVPLSGDGPAADTSFDAPHFVDPAAAILHPVGLVSPTSDASVPLPPSPAPVPGLVLSGSKLERLALLRSRLRAPRRRDVLALTTVVTLGGQRDRVGLSLVRRRGRGTVTVARSRVRALSAGQSAIVLYARGLKPGSYVLVAHGARSGTLRARVVLTRRRR